MWSAATRSRTSRRGRNDVVAARAAGAATPSPINQRTNRSRSRTSLVSPTRRPARSTATRSAQASTSSSLWVISTTATPARASWRNWAHSRSASGRASTDVGSSRITTRAPRFSTLTSSTSCFPPTVSSPARRRGSMSGARSRNRRSTCRQAPRPGGNQRGAPGQASIRFSATDRAGTRLNCWNTIPMPAARAARGESSLSGWPSARMSPASAGRKPYTIFISVLLPAPFSPSSASTCPAGMSRSTPSTASTGPKRLWIPRSCSVTGPARRWRPPRPRHSGAASPPRPTCGRGGRPRPTGR